MQASERTARARIEGQALRLTIAGNLFMALLGFGFALALGSDAILLDGMFSFVDGLLALVSLRVAALILRPPDQDAPFGYAVYEPLLNLAKGLMVLTIVVAALVGASDALLTGGREVDAGWAVVYALIAFLGCLLLAAVNHRLAARSGSPIVALDAKEWLIDGAFSLAVAVAFGCVLLLADTRYVDLAPYADPVIVLILCVMMLPVPLQVVRRNWRQLLGRSPEPEAVDDVDTMVRGACGALGVDVLRLRVGRLGRMLYVQLYCTVSGEGADSLADQDRFRSELFEALRARYPELAMDVIFTADAIWAERAIRPAEVGT